jgi:hypothetical protein
MASTRLTYLGYAAVDKGNVRAVQPPRILADIPIRLSAGIGLVYFVVSLVLLQEGGIYKEHFLPILGIVAAFGLFVYQTVIVVGGGIYRRRLRMLARQGVAVYVPLPLLQHVQDVHQKQGLKMPPGVFDDDLSQTKTLVELYQSEGLSPQVQKIADSFTVQPRAS